MERCIYNKVERRPLILLFARRGREYSRSVNFEEEKKKSVCVWISMTELWNVVFITKWKEYH